MATTSTPIFPQTIQTEVVEILPATTTSLVTLYTGGTNGSKIENIVATNTDTASAYSVQLWLTISSVNYLLGTVSIPLSSGNTSSAASVFLLSSSQLTGINKDSNGNPYLYLGSNAVLKVASLTTVNTGKVLTFIAQGGDY